MTWKWYIKVLLSMIFFLNIIIFGSNMSVKRLADITNKNISPPFVVKSASFEVIQLDILGKDYNYSTAVIKGEYDDMKTSIQNSLGTVKCNIAPRFEYINYLWVKGVNKLKEDLKR